MMNPLSDNNSFITVRLEKPTHVKNNKGKLTPRSLFVLEKDFCKNKFQIIYSRLNSEIKKIE